MKETQMTMFGVSPIKQADYLAFHDESGNDKDRFFLHGVLFVPRTKCEQYLKFLLEWRDGFAGRIHFKKVREHKFGSFNATIPCNLNWFTLSE